MGVETGIIFAFAAMLTWGVGDFLIQRSIRKVGNIETLAFIGIIGTIVLFPFAAKEFYLLKDSGNIFLLIALGVVTFVAAMFNFEALKEGKLSVIDVVLEIELPVTIVLGFVFFKESFSIVQWLIIFVIFIGIVLIASKSFSHWKSKLEKGVLVALVASLFMGGVNFLTGASSKMISPIMAIWASWVVFTVITLVFIFKRHDAKKLVVHAKEYKGLLVAAGLFDTAAWLFYAKATFNHQISIITAITESYPAVALFLGVTLNKEKIRWHQYMGAVVALVSSVLLCLTI